MLPFLRKKQEAAIAQPVDVIERKPDDDSGYDIIDAIAEDMLAALEKKDKGMLKSALASLCEYLQDMDEQQDQQLKEG